jgi:NTP pyrophosphatase (non-canonical NTP hydrolase)
MKHGEPINGMIDYFLQGASMGYGTNGLTFNTLRGGNVARLPEFKNKHGGLAHSKSDGSDWSPAQWLQAVVGELGEYANLRKKFERGDIETQEFLREAADELADVATYLDILAMQLGIDLGEAIINKFNRVSTRVGSTVRIDSIDWYRTDEPPR